MEDMPPGFRFYPTEEELASFYLRHKLQEEIRQELDRLIDRVIPTVNIYEFNPWDLPQLSLYLCHNDPEQWFFFVPRQESEGRGGRPTRLTTIGYWKATGSPGFVYSSDNRTIGFKRTMVFYKGRAPNGRKTEWKMNEYKAIEDLASSSNGATPILREEFSLCRIYKKSKCIRSFDRRPPTAGGGGVPRQIREPAAAHHQRQVNIGATSSATHQYQSPDDQMAAHENDRRTMRSSPPESTSTSSSGSGDHGNNINNDNNIPCRDHQITWESNSSSAAMAVDYDECFWNLEGFWVSISKTS